MVAATGLTVSLLPPSAHSPRHAARRMSCFAFACVQTHTYMAHKGPLINALATVSRSASDHRFKLHARGHSTSASRQHHRGCRSSGTRCANRQPLWRWRFSSTACEPSLREPEYAALGGTPFNRQSRCQWQSARSSSHRTTARTSSTVSCGHYSTPPLK